MGTLGILPSKCQTMLSFSRLATCQFYRHKATIPQNFTDYESIKQNYNPQIPKYFNFAKDVLDMWAEREKVQHLQNIQSSPVVFFDCHMNWS